jgi:hypothetical protein
MNDPKSSAQQQALARQRAQLIMQVRSGVLSAQEAARQLAISRKTYYKWERRALAAMVEALGNREPGRPPLPIDPEKEALQRQTQELQAKLEVLEQTERRVLVFARPGPLSSAAAPLLSGRPGTAPAATQGECANVAFADLISSTLFSAPRPAVSFRLVASKQIGEPLTPTDRHAPKEFLLPEHNLPQPHHLE